MKLISNVTVAVKKGTLSQIIEEFSAGECFVRSMQALERNLYQMEIIYDDRNLFNACMDSLKKMSDKYAIVSVKNSLEEMIKGGILSVKGKMPLEQYSDFEMGLLGAVELALEKIENDEGNAFSGILKNVGVITGVRAREDLRSKAIFSRFVQAERDCAILGRFSGLNGLPVAINFNQPEDFIKTLRGIESSFAALRITGIEEADLFFYEQIFSELHVPVISRDLDDIPVYMLSLLNRLSLKNKIHPSDTTVGIMGMDISAIRLTRLLKKSRFGRVLGYDQNEKALLSFENEGGLATSTENIFSNTDVILLMKNNFEYEEYEKLRPGQLIISLLGPRDVDLNMLKERGVREFVQGDVQNLSWIFPGMVVGVLNAGLKTIDDMRIIELAKKTANLLAVDYSFPDLFGDIHSLIADLLDPVVLHDR
ncbi:MAG: hypothetical protein CVV44_01565 [Spirochaetae bacterium HGW-Spirochaetae-1]|jgi:acetolactate synthase small subunit|nr:MAG: hypothetical protein CVV44_01565 [Spirochaetae bacterium HGW-Spirochaetae-1]